MIWHSSTVEEVLNELDVNDKEGLKNGIADMRLEDYDMNVISRVEPPKFSKYFFSQLKSKLVIALMIISVASFVVSLMYDEVSTYSPLLIIAILGINALISAYYLFKCNNTLDDIRQITNPNATVLRDGIIKSLNAAELVPGDIIILEEGDYIPADARLIETNEFRCNETVLTGIDIPVEKNPDIIFEEITTAEKRSNMIFSGCSVVHGNAKAVVVATGLNTELGRTSAIMQQTGDDTLPLQEHLELIGRIVNFSILIVCLFVFIMSMVLTFSNNHFASVTVNNLMNAVALAVAAIPEGLPAITTIVIAIGMHRILKDKIILKDASAAELLGKTDVICCDKTGVFTRNKMELCKIYDGKREIDLDTNSIDEDSSLILRLATACSTLSNDSTENAIEKACLTYNSMSVQDVKAIFPHIAEIPFSSERKAMAVITMINERPFAIIKGAPEYVIPRCNHCNNEEITAVNEALTNDAYRVVAIAMKPLATIPANPNPDDIETNLAFVGLLAFNDPPREGVIEEIEICQKAGIKTVMLTGDNLNTAKAIARRIGILKDGTFAITGTELNELTDAELAGNIEKYTVFARISPADKVRIVKAWQQRKKIVTITGDGVEDADSLALADVGCAIGKFGADLAKGNADIVISNNRFDSIVRAIKESRGLFSNIRKSVYYLFSCNFAEILSVVFGLFIFKSAPVAAVQLLWINLLTDSAPALSLSMENAEVSLMNSKTLSAMNRIFNLKSALLIVLQSVFIAVITLISFSSGFDFGDTVTATTMAFTTLGISQIFHCINNKFEGSILGKNILSNKFMNYAVSITLFIILFLIFTPAGFLFGLKILKFKEFIVSFALAILIIPFTELCKLIFKKI